MPCAGQHILSAVAEILFGAATCSWELHPSDQQQLDTLSVDLQVGGPAEFTPLHPHPPPPTHTHTNTDTGGWLYQHPRLCNGSKP